MGKRIAFVGTGALGGYVGGWLAHLDEDVTLIDLWPEHIEAIRSRGLELDGVTPEEKFTVTKARTMHMTEVQTLAKEKPIDIAFISVKSYDTEWAAMMIKPYLAADGYAVSLQNCLNEEKIAGVVGWGKTLGVVASLISVNLYEPGRIRRTVEKGGDKHTIFRIGEVNGVVTDRVKELVALFSKIDSTKATTNLWGERWTKLTQNSMRNGVSAATGLTGADCDKNTALRRFAIELGAEAIKVGRALGYEVENMGKLKPDRLVAAADGSADAMAEIEELMMARTKGNPRAGIQRPSMAQDMHKGRRTEIQFMNGFIAEKGKALGIPTPAHEKLTKVVTRVERGELPQSPANLGG